MTETRARTGIFGGTFNPIHIGHLRAAEEVVEALGLERRVFIPSADPPHKTDFADDRIASAALRLEWVELAIRDNPRLAVDPLEIERAEKRIGSSLLAHPTVYVGRPELVAALDGLDLAEIAITSSATLIAETPPGGTFTAEEIAGVGVTAGLADGEKCQRCWMVLPEVGGDDRSPDTCDRCADAVAQLGAAAD